MKNNFRRGTTMIEYVLLLAVLGIIAICALHYIGATAGHKLNKVSRAINDTK